ncbi:MAG: class I SAM-dependent methyltransferase [Planctomycetes bacterium]|nr:class I SAM-dependent methyltransferase [Planctomycetota bacterium]
MEFGVHTGKTINVIAMHTENTVYGFDSFEGLPEDWRQGKLNGRYSTDGNLPDVKPNVELISGWFEETLPQFLEKHPESVALIHIDCDLYSSTKTVLTHLKKRIVAGTVIVFDELFNYPEYEKHEIKAFYEFLKETNVQFEWIGVQGQISLVPDHIEEY